MKNVLFIIILTIGIILGFYGKVFFEDSQKNNIGLNTYEGNIKVEKINNSIQLDKNLSIFKVNVFIEYILKLEKKYGSNFPKYITEIIKYIEENNFNNGNFYDNNSINHSEIVKKELINKDTNNFSDTASIIYSLYDKTEIKQYSKQECKKYLDGIDDLDGYFSSKTNLLYSNYRNSPFLNFRVEKNDFNKFYRKTEKKNLTTKHIDYIIKKAIISDFLWLSNSKSLKLKDLSDNILCSKTNSKRQCLKFKKDLLELNKEGIINKFSSNERKYDLDAFFILYKIGSLSKYDLTSKLCMITE